MPERGVVRQVAAGRACSTCGEVKPLTAFYLDSRKPDHRRPRCKSCFNERVRAWQVANPDKVQAAMTRWLASNRGVRIVGTLAWRKANPDKAKALTQRFNNTPAHRAAVAKWRRENPERARSNYVAWTKANRTKVRDYANVRRARILNQPSEHFLDIEVFERDGWRCGICGERINRRLRHPHPRSPSLDHVWHISCGGPHLPENSRATHKVCNNRRGNRRDADAVAAAKRLSLRLDLRERALSYLAQPGLPVGAPT